MEVNVPLWGVLVAALSAMVIGTVWYSPAVFGRQWQKAVGLTDKDMQNKVAPAMITLVVVSLVTAYVLAHFIVLAHYFYNFDWVMTGATTAFWAWLGIGATAIVAHGVFEPRRKAAMYINLGNRFVTLLVMGLILGLFLR